MGYKIADPLWSLVKTKYRLDKAKEELANLCRDMTTIDSQIAMLQETKKSLKRKISNKHRYVSQLQVQYGETRKKEEDVLRNSGKPIQGTSL